MEKRKFIMIRNISISILILLSLLTACSEDGELDTGGQNLADAIPLAPGQTRSGIIASSNDLRYYKITIQENAQYTIVLDRLEDDLDLYLYSISPSDSTNTSDLTTLAYPWEAGTDPETIKAELSPGTYYLGIFPYEEASGSYRITCSAPTKVDSIASFSFTSGINFQYTYNSGISYYAFPVQTTISPPCPGHRQ